MALTSDQKKVLRRMICQKGKANPQGLEEYALKSDEDVIAEITAWSPTRLSSLNDKKEVIENEIDEIEALS